MATNDFEEPVVTVRTAVTRTIRQVAEPRGLVITAVLLMIVAATTALAPTPWSVIGLAALIVHVIITERQPR